MNLGFVCAVDSHGHRCMLVILNLVCGMAFLMRRLTLRGSVPNGCGGINPHIGLLVLNHIRLVLDPIVSNAVALIRVKSFIGVSMVGGFFERSEVANAFDLFLVCCVDQATLHQPGQHNIPKTRMVRW